MVKSKLEQLEIVVLSHCFEICLLQNCLTYNNTVYNQQKGLAMGSPLSPLFADVFMGGLCVMKMSQSWKATCIGLLTLQAGI